MRYANCHFLILASKLPDDQSNAAQDQWVKTQLGSIPAGVDYIFVALHRPPCTALTHAIHKPGPRLVRLAKMLQAGQRGSRAHIIVLPDTYTTMSAYRQRRWRGSPGKIHTRH